MLRNARATCLALLLSTTACALNNPIADFGPDSGTPAVDTPVASDVQGAVDVPALPDVPTTMDVMVVPDAGEIDAGEPDAGSIDVATVVDSGVDGAVADTGVDAPPPPPVDSGVDVPPPPVDTGIDAPPPPVDAGGHDAGVADTGTDVPVVTDVPPPPPAGCGIGDPCTVHDTMCDLLAGHCVVCGGMNQTCCPVSSCDSPLSCDWFSGYVCH